MHEKRKIYIQNRESETLALLAVEGRRVSRRKIIKQAEQRQNVNELTAALEEREPVTSQSKFITGRPPPVIFYCQYVGDSSSAALYLLSRP
jgi:hypothetical protein